MVDLDIETVYRPTWFFIKYNTHFRGSQSCCVPKQRGLANVTPI